MLGHISGMHISPVLISDKVAAAWRQPDICRKLIDLGADTSALTEADAIYLLPL